MKVDIIGVPLDLGANRRGVDMGPSAIRYAGLKESIQKLNIEYRDLGNLNVAVSENSNENVLNSKLKHLNEINKVNEELTAKVIKSLQDGSLPIVLGGDHSIAVGAILGTQCVRKNVGVIWLDAHGDFNNKNTTESGNLHG
ncbi:MAG TPA: arginase family protein, partial [Clostridia bacterium]|nr:arginase family protein [Clostridia bacterium]